MVTTPNYDLDIDTTLGGNNASDYVVPSQKAIKAYVDNSTGGNVMWGNIAGNISNQTDLQDALNDKQATLVSGTNIKTVNNTSLLGSGNISVATSAQGALANSAIQPNDNVSELTNDAGYITSSALTPYVLSEDLASVATSGSYNDLSNKPTIPTVNNATLTIQKNGTTVKTFTANASSNVTANITVPTKTSDLTNDSGYTTNVGTVTSVNNVSPVNGNVTLTIPAAQVQANWNETNTSSKAYIQNKPTIPTVNNATLTITQDNVTKGTFTANASSNVTIDLDGGSSRNIGEIVTSTIPLTDAGLHLLDGALISGSGSYSDFVTYISGLVSTYSDLFTTESNWQSTVTQYGVCGKFVYDSTNNTVRLPKITGFIEGTTDVNALGDLLEAGLPNITGTFSAENTRKYVSGAFNYEEDTFARSTGSGSASNPGFNMDASRSSTIYGNSNTVQPQSIKVLYYIVVATTTKTEIEVDIDEIATDLNSKADTNLSNVPASKGILTQSYVNGTSWYRIYSDGWCEQGGLIAITSGTSGFSVSLLQNYINTNYQVILSAHNSAYSTYGYGAIDLTVSGFKAYCSNNNSRSTFWLAQGYIR